MDSDVPDDDRGPIETIAFLARSHTRVDLLRRLGEDGEATHATLHSAFDTDRTTITLASYSPARTRIGLGSPRPNDRDRPKTGVRSLQRTATTSSTSTSFRNAARESTICR